MAITPLTITQLQERIINKMILSVNGGELDSSKHIDPNIRNSLSGAFAKAMAAGFDENNDVLLEILKQLFPQTATNEYLELWANFFGITRKSAVKASGNVVFTGTATTSIAAGTLIKKANDIQYETQATKSIALSSISVSSITRSGTTATATTASEHGLASGVSVTISGANEAEYNITATITVTSATTFTYIVSGTPSTPATGTILVAFTATSIQVIASEFGSDGNSAGGSQLTLSSPLVGVDNTCYIDYEGISGGLDVESDDELRVRLLERTANFTAPYTVAGLPVFIKENIAGITRVWVQAATPSAGYTTIYFTRDNDTNIIPTSAQVQAVKDIIIDADTGIKPANIADSYVVVAAPTAVPADFTFSSLSPNTEDMQNAITQTLTDYFKSKAVELEKSIPEEEFNALIYSVVDSSGNSPIFALSAPAGDITITTGEIATLGTITYP